MIITKVEIISYGKWKHVNFPMNAQLQVFNGPNESGKSSIMNLIKGILFEFPNKRDGKYSFESLDASVSGGRLHMLDPRYGNVVVERFVGKAKPVFQVLKEDQTPLSETEVEEFLYYVTKDRFERIFSFNLEQLHELKTVEEEELNRYFLSIGLSGSEQLIETSKKLSQEADKLYAKQATKREMNKLLKELSQLKEKVFASKEQDQRYQQLSQEYSELSQVVIQLETEVKNAYQQQERFAKLQTHFQAYEQWKHLEAQKIDLPELVLDKDSDTQLLTLVEKSKHLQKQYVQFTQAKDNYQLKLNDVNDEWFTKYKFKMEQLLSLKEEGIQSQERLQSMKNDALHIQELMEREEQKWRINPSNKLPEPLSTQEKKELDLWMNTLSQLELKEQFHPLREKELHQRIEELEQKRAACLEQQPVYKMVETRLPWHRLGFLFSFIGVGGLFFQIFPMSMLWVSLVILLGSIAMEVNRWKEQNKALQQSNIQQQKYQEQLIQIQDQLEQEHQQFILFSKSIQKVKAQKESVQQRIATLMKDKGYQETHIDAKTLVKEDPLADYRQWMIKLEWIKEQITHCMNQVDNVKEQLNWYWNEKQKTMPFLVSEAFFELEKAYDVYVLREKQKQELKVSIKEITYQCEQVTKELEQTSSTIQVLLDETNCHTPEEFLIFWKQYKEQKAIEEQAKMLQVTLKPWLNELQQISTQEAIDQSYLLQKERTEKLQEKYRNLHQSMAKIQQEIHQLEESGVFRELLETFEQKKEEFRRIVIRWSGLKLASQLLEQTLMSGKETQLHSMLIDATHYFKLLTKQRYQAIVLTKKKQMVQRVNGEWFYLDQLSQGTLDQLYVSIRLAFVKNIAQFAPLPVIVDDGFVNFDQERKEVMMNLLLDLSRYTQIIYFTLDEKTSLSKKAQITLSREESRKEND